MVQDASRPVTKYTMDSVCRMYLRADLSSNARGLLKAACWALEMAFHMLAGSNFHPTHHLLHWDFLETGLRDGRLSTAAVFQPQSGGNTFEQADQLRGSRQ